MLYPAVRVQNAMKSYEDNKILNNLDMLVQSGTIYGLLGSSGCGKTTLLSCIVGLKKLDNGSIAVYGHRPNSAGSGIPGKTVGYQPQELALYEQFTVREILYYYAKIYSMKKSETCERIEFLSNFLDLPPCSKRISEASGGEQRRISLAVSMLHRPKLLVLDEPTVGLDPLIRDNIWIYLKTLVKTEHISLVMSTHYIEEARNADTVGIMRNGRLLVEKCPQALLEDHKTNLLENIVLKYCMKDEMENSKSINLNNNSPNYVLDCKDVEKTVEKTDTVVCLKYKIRSPDDNTLFYPRNNLKNANRQKSLIEKCQKCLLQELDKIQALTYRNFTLLFRSWVFVMILIVLPALNLILFNTVIGKDPKNNDIAVVNNEFDSTDFLNLCKKQSSGCFHDNLSCNFFDQPHVSETRWKEFASEREALESVQKGKTMGFITIPKNFTEHMKYRLVERNFVTAETLEGSKISIRLDMSSYLSSSILISNIYKSYLQFVKNIIEDCDQDSRLVDIPMKFNAIYGSDDFGFSGYIQPPLIVGVIFLLSTFISTPHIMDKKNGSLARSMVAGVEFYQVVLSYLISYGCIIVIQLALAFGVLIFLSDNEIEGSLALFFVCCFLMGICGLSFGFLFGTICDYEVHGSMCLLAVVLPALLSSGCLWPLQGIPNWAWPIVNLLPLTLPIESVRSIVSRGWEFSHSHVWPGFVSSIAWILFCVFLSATFHRIKK